MSLPTRLLLLLLLPVFAASAVLAQWGGFGRRARDYGSEIERPTDQNTHTEWAFTRLVYSNVGDIGPPIMHRRLHHWSEDWPFADWHFARGVQRLTRINARYAGQLVHGTNDDIFNWPWIYANQVGNWSLSDGEARRLREYLLRGGFLVVDNFHGTRAWQTFLIGIRKVFPSRPIEDLQNDDPIFHNLYDVGRRTQIPGAEYEWTHKTYVEVPGGKVPRWGAIRDDKGRIMVVICFNMHLGDAWEHADDPRYPEHFTSQAYRIGIDDLIYAMTH